MKKLFLALIIAFFIAACKAQQPLTKIRPGLVKANNITYNVLKPNNRVVEVINTNNRLTGVKSFAPKMPLDIKMPQYMKVNEKQLINICAAAIPLTTLKKLPLGYNDYLFISIKINTKGEVLEMEFLVKNTSLITANEIQQIEQNIKKSLKITFTKGIERYFDGVNYFHLDAPIQYSEMLKAKEGK